MERDGDKVDVQTVRRKSAIAHPVKSIDALQHGERAFDAAANAADEPVANALPMRQPRDVFVPPVLDAVLDSARFESSATLLLLVSFIGVNGAFVANDKCVGDLAFVGLGRCYAAAADQARTLIDADMKLVAEKQTPAVSLARPVGIVVVRRATFHALRRRARRRCRRSARNQRRVDQRALA